MFPFAFHFINKSKQVLDII